MLKGVDRIVTVKDATTLTPGKSVVSLLITPLIADRLRAASQMFQKIKYHKLVFRVNSQCSTMTAGGYVAGFVKDPADEIPSESVAVQYLMSNTGSYTQPWWRSTVHNIRASQRMFFTDKPALGADAIREYSPGRFYVIVDSTPSQTCPVTVDLEWTVELREATFKLPDTSTVISSSHPDISLKTYGLPSTSALAGHVVLKAGSTPPRPITPAWFQTLFGFLPYADFCATIPTTVQCVLTGENAYQSITATHVSASVSSGGVYSFILSAFNDATSEIRQIDATWPIMDSLGEVITPFSAVIYDSASWSASDTYTITTRSGQPIPLDVFRFLHPEASISLPSEN